MAEYIPTIWWHHLLGPLQLALTHENMDFASFNYVNISRDIIDVIYAITLTKTVIQRISTLPYPEKDIAERCFLKDLSVSELQNC